MTDEQIERVALALWAAQFGKDATEPLREKGGALDPDAWCMEAAQAIANDQPVPRIYSNYPAPSWVYDVAEQVLACD